MRYLIDTNVLLRWSHADSPDHALTFNVADFARYEGITPVAPSDVFVE